MFIDQVTGEVSKKGEKQVKLITKTRFKRYVGPKGEVQGEGHEIAKELIVTQDTADKLAIGELIFND